MLKKWLFRMAKSPCMGKVVGKAFQYASWAIPVKKIRCRKEILVFHHSQPSYPNHLILSPKKPVQNLQQMSAAPFSMYFSSIWESANELCAMFPAYLDSFTLVANGGKRQEVQQVHFHMFTDHPMVHDDLPETSNEHFFAQNEDLSILSHPHPEWEIHFILKPASSSQIAGNDQARQAYFRSVLLAIHQLDASFSIVQKGYSLVYQYNRQKTNQESPVFHIAAGRRL